MPKAIAALQEARTRHQRRHDGAHFQVALADQVDLLNVQAWDGLVEKHTVLLSRPYLRMLEQHGPDNLSMRYALVAVDGKPAVALAFQMVDVDGTRLIKGRSNHGWSQLARKALKVPLKQWKERLLVAGNLLCWGQHAMAVAPGFPLEEAFEAAAEAAYRIRRADKLEGQSDFVMLKDVTPAYAKPARTLTTFSYKEVETEPNMVLAIQPSWKTMEDYLAGMNAKYRKNARSVPKDIEKAGCTVGPLTWDAATTQAMHELYMQVHVQAPVRLFTLQESFQAAMAQTFGPNFKGTGIWQAGRLVGFVTTLKDGDTAIGYHVGFDYAVNATAPLYFRLLQACVEDAITMGCSRLSLGRTALEPKAKLGAKPEPLSVWVRHRVPMMNAVVRSLLGTLEFDDAPERSPFKEG